MSLWVVEAMAVGVGSGNGLCFAVGFDGQWQWVGFRWWLWAVVAGGSGLGFPMAFRGFRSGFW